MCCVSIVRSLYIRVIILTGILNMFRPQKPLKNTRIKLYKTVILPFLLYGSETLTIKARETRRITAAEMKYMRRTVGDTRDRLQNKYTTCKGIKNNTNFRQITGIQEKLDTTCK
jgi:5-bromo-4-chloroindolyl phosphate hydrolysis protein